MINGLGLGGWLMWSLPQPVFMDGRLEVMTESFYTELVRSWDKGLANLVRNYTPKLVIYNYEQYYPWTTQLAKIPRWRLIYLDGHTAIYAMNGYALSIPSVNLSRLASGYSIKEHFDKMKTVEILNHPASPAIKYFIESLYKRHDYCQDELINLGSFSLQVKDYDAIKKFYEANTENFTELSPENRRFVILHSQIAQGCL